MQQTELQKRARLIKSVHEDYKKKLDVLNAQKEKIVQKLNKQRDAKNSADSSFIRWIKSLFKE